MQRHDKRAESQWRASRVLYWGDAVVQAIRVGKPAPTVAARSLAVVHTAIFDAWAAYDARAIGTRLGGSLRRPAGERTLRNKEEAVSYAAYRALVDLFPAQKADFDTKLTALGYAPGNRTMNLATPAGVGNVAAAAVLAYRRNDGANQAGGYADISGYQPVNTPTTLADAGRWQPLTVRTPGGVLIQQYSTPHWGGVTPFAMTSGRQFRPAAVRGLWGTKTGDRQMREVLAISAGLTDRDKAIAEYWADGPGSESPPGHWCLMAKFVSQRDRHDIDADATMFFAVANALLDAGIASWDTKRAFDTSRPITQIREAMRGQMVLAWGGPGKGTMPIRGEDWLPYQSLSFVTPPFPEFVSGHSTFSAAVAVVLEEFTGSKKFGASATIAAGSSTFEDGVPSRPVTLSWKKFTDAAEEAGYSRLIGGIHFAEANVEGQRIGRAVGRLVWKEAQFYIRDGDHDGDDENEGEREGERRSQKGQ